MHRFITKYKKWFSLVLTAIMLFSLVVPQSAKAATVPDTLAKWDFSKGEFFTPTSGISVNLDKTLSAVGATIASPFVAGPSGSKVPNASAWQTTGESYWQVSLSTKDYQNINLSSKQYGSSTGPKEFKIQYKLENGSWTDVPNGTVTISSASTWVTANVTLPSEANNKDIVYVRWLLASATSIGNGTIQSGGTSRIADIIFTGESLGAPILEKTANPDANKITYSSYNKVTGAAGAVVGNADVKLYYEDKTLAGSAKAAEDGSFTVDIAKPQSNPIVYVTAQETGKDSSEKVPVNYTGNEIAKTAAPIASKISFASYTKVTGSAGAVAGGVQVKLYFDDNTEVATANAAQDGSFDLAFTNTQSKTVVNLIAQEVGKDPSDKVTINYTGPQPSGYAPGDVVFSQIYFNGGNSGAFYNTKFFELYNNTDKDIDLSSWSIAYTSASTMKFGAGQALKGVIKSHGYFLVAGTSGATGQPLPVTPDATLTLNPSGSTGGALVLASTKNAVTGVDDPNAIDMLAYTNGTANFTNPLYWGKPINDSSIGNGTILRKTDIGSDPRSAFGLGNCWFTKDPSKDFVLNKLTGTDAPTEIVVHNSKFMLSPDSSKITYTKANGTSTIVGQAGSVPASAKVKVYLENSALLTSPTQGTASTDGSFTITYQDTNNSSSVYLTQIDSSQPNPIESSYGRVDAAGTSNTVTSLGDLRKNDVNGMPINIGYKTTITGTATTDNMPSGDVKTYFFIKDSKGAINVVNGVNPSTPIKVGEKYSIDGRVVVSGGMTQFIPSAIHYVGPDTLPTPTPITIDTLNESNESKLVTFTGVVKNKPSTGPDYDITVSDSKGANLAIVRVQGSIEDIELGATYTFTGTVVQFKKAAPYNSGYYLLPSDIKGQLVFQHTAVKKAYIGLDVPFTATAKNASSVTLYYKGQNDTDYQSVIMNSADHKNYNAKILWADVPKGEKFYYYIEAASSDEKQYAGSKEAPLEVPIVEDTDGPAFSNPSPVDGDNIETKHPVVSVSLDDPSGVDTKATTMKIDSKDFTSKAVISETEIKLTLTPSDDLTEGEHTVTVTSKDKLGNSSTYSWKFTVAKRFIKGNHYRGTTHNHTIISHDAAGKPEDALKAAEKYHYDFFAFSDHSHDIDASLLNKDTVDRNGMKERSGGADWKLTKDLAKEYTKDGSFVVFPGFEMTSTTWGHSNVFGTENFVDRLVDGGAYQKLQNYYAWTLTYDNIVAQFNHPKMSANAFDNFIPYNKNVDRLFTMLEVGNGSGMYSYANAEDKYYSALDLGWHVAPTYGEDNHDATWGQTKKRTVIVASDLSEQSLFESMKKMRVYMSEDPNFSLDVSASGFYMGSIVDTDTLSFKIDGSDPVSEDPSNPDYSYVKTPSNDAIAKVELITNNGTVIDTYKPTDDSTSFHWEPNSITVAGGQQWFVVKVTQKDGDRIYSAPIWSPAKDLAVSVSDLNTPDGAIIGGVPANLTAGLSNQGSINVSNLTASFYYDSIDTANFIGAATIDKLAANTSSTASVVWTNPVAGSHKIIVVLKAGDGHDLGNNKYEQTFTIKAPLNKLVMIDGSHNNENTKTDTGKYSDNLRIFTTLMKQQGYAVVENSTTLSDQVLKNVAVLMLTHPATAYSESEIAAINTFVTNGGSLLLTEKSNFGGSNQNLNDILSGIGSSILVNNDGVFDETSYGNFWGKPLDSNFSVRLHPVPLSNSTLTDFVPTIEYYSGSSLAKNDGTGKKVELTDSSTVTILARGNESTFQDTPTIKSDSYSYNVKTSNGKTGPALEDVTGGSVIPMIASEQIGKGRIIVSGMNIFNDKQMDQSFSPKGNDPFAVNAVNWLSQLGPNMKTIGDARQLTEGENTVVVGTVTTTAFFDAVYIQDNTGGIMAYNEVPAGSLKPGDQVRIYGHIKIFENNYELEFGSFADSVVKISSGPPVEPKLVSTKDSNAEANQGLLLKVKGKVVSKYDSNSYVINDGSGDTLVFTDGYIINQSGPIPNVKIGDTLEAVGLAGKFLDGNRLRVRDTKELNVVNTTVPDMPVVKGVTDKDVVITGTAEANSTVVAKVSGKEIGHATTDAEGKFTISIAKQTAGTKISVTAIDAANNESEAMVVTVTGANAPAPAAPIVNSVSDNDEVITGTAEAGLTVIAKVKSQEIGRTIAGGNGQFTIKIAKQVAGTEIVVTAIDASGNTSDAKSVIVGETINKPVDLTPEVISGVAIIDQQMFEKAVKSAIKYRTPIVIDLGDHKAVKIAFTKDQVKELKANGIPLNVKNQDVQLNIPLSFVKDGQSFEFLIKQINDVKNAKSSVYEFTILIDGKEVHQFAEPITLTFNVDVSKVKKTSDLKVCYYNEQTKEWVLVPGAVYKNGKVEVKTNHFTKYAVFESDGNQGNNNGGNQGNNNGGNQGNNNGGTPGKGLANTSTNMYNILFSGLILLVLGSTLVVVRRRKQV